MKLPNETLNNDLDIIDSRDLIERIEELEAELDGVELDEETSNYMLDGNEMNSEYEELEKLHAFAEEFKNACSDYECGGTAIRESHFRDFAEQEAEDIGAINSNASWPLNHIDWDAASEELKMDYITIEFDGVEYLVR